MINTTLCYIEKDNKYLVIHRTKKKNDLNQDKWIGVGGKFFENESPEECLLREVKQETGLTLNSYFYRGVVTFVSDKWESELMHLFTSNDFQGEMIECDEGDLCWMDKEFVENSSGWAGDKLFLKLLRTDIPFFSMKLKYQGEKLIFASLNGKEIENI